MNNTQKDRYENKLNRFIKECDKEWQKYKVEKPEYCRVLYGYNNIVERVRELVTTLKGGTFLFLCIFMLFRSTTF